MDRGGKGRGSDKHARINFTLSSPVHLCTFLLLTKSTCLDSYSGLKEGLRFCVFFVFVFVFVFFVLCTYSLRISPSANPVNMVWYGMAWHGKKSMGWDQSYTTQFAVRTVGGANYDLLL